VAGLATWNGISAPHALKELTLLACLLRASANLLLRGSFDALHFLEAWVSENKNLHSRADVYGCMRLAQQPEKMGPSPVSDPWMAIQAFNATGSVV
jgi:hypothetical protein